MTFNEIMDRNPDSIEMLYNKGMMCMGCPFSEGETLEQGAAVHGLDADELVEELNKGISRE